MHINISKAKTLNRGWMGGGSRQEGNVQSQRYSELHLHLPRMRLRSVLSWLYSLAERSLGK